MDLKLFFLLCHLAFGWCGIIIPEELPSLLSVAYSNIPPIKKGTDSRVGFGFAFGNHADLQVMFELGPQTNTGKLAPAGFQSTAKRQAPSPEKYNKNKEKFLQSDSGNYLKNWAMKMKSPKPSKATLGEVPNLEDSVVELVRNDKGEYEIHQPKPGHMPQRVMDELKRLYGQKKDEAKKLTEEQKKSSTKLRTDAEVKKITEDLSNVDLD
ncbi:hypothetical protein O0L34_g12276 [Tuta absoluta]|nr:hypothetical protein O0L34_g12276 [Tuta absoluta]